MRLIDLVLILIMGFVVSACASTRPMHTEGDSSQARLHLNISAEKTPTQFFTGPVKISRAEAYQKGDDLIVFGMVRRMHEVQLPGHIDLTVRDVNGQVLHRESTRVVGLTSNRNGMLERPFRFRLAMIAPEDAQIDLRYHDYSMTENVNCSLTNRSKK